MAVRGIRGAITAEANTAEAIVEATETLLLELVSLNDLDIDEVAFAYLTTTTDLDATDAMWTFFSRHPLR